MVGSHASIGRESGQAGNRAAISVTGVVRGQPGRLFKLMIDYCMDANQLQDRTKTFAHRCVKLAVSLPKGVLTRHIQNQAIRSSTSVAANYRAACLAHSKAAFASKISIVIEEVDETAFWIEFLVEEGILSREKCEKLLSEAKELTAIFIASRKTSQNNNQ